jgi:hypothetical protein
VPADFATALARVKSAAADADRALVPGLAALTIPGLKIDPWLAAIIIGALMADDPSPNPEDDRRRSLADWTPRIKAKLDEWRKDAKSEPPPPIGATPKAGEVTAAGTVSTAITPLGTLPTTALPPPPPSAVPTYTAPQLPGVIDPEVITSRLPTKPAPPAPPVDAHVTGTLIPAPPPGMPEPLREAWIQAKVRAGEYARGLGSVIRQWPNDVEREVWAGESIVTEVDVETRRAKRQAIRDLTAEAVEKRWTPEKLASELGHKTQEWSRNWNRIAATELQNAHNEGVAITALRNDGTEARVARIPESNACADCKRLFLDGEGKPIIWPLTELLANGTNVGKPRADWLPVLTAAHPRCRCSVLAVPPGMTLNRKGWLVPE